MTEPSKKVRNGLLHHVLEHNFWVADSWVGRQLLSTNVPLSVALLTKGALHFDKNSRFRLAVHILSEDVESLQNNGAAKSHRQAVSILKVPVDEHSNSDTMILIGSCLSLRCFVTHLVQNRCLQPQQNDQ